MNISGSILKDAIKDGFSRKTADNEEAGRMIHETTRPAGAEHLSVEDPPKSRLILDIHTDLGESIIWDDRTATLYFVDINSKTIYGCKADGTELFSITANEMVGTIALTTDPNLLLAAMNRSVHLVDVAEKRIGRAIATVPEEHDWTEPPNGMRFNDGKASPGGAFIVGRMHMNWRSGAPGRLYRLRWDELEKGYFEELLGPESCVLPNGLAWDEPYMYHADTSHRTITAYQTDSSGVPLRNSTGNLEGKVILRVPESDGVGPDGMTISRDGHLWVAVPGDGKVHGAVICYSSKTGKEITRVKLDVSMPVCCTFGGVYLDTLFVTSRKEKGVQSQPKHWGGIFAVTLPGEFGMAPAYKVKIPS